MTEVQPFIPFRGRVVSQRVYNLYGIEPWVTVQEIRYRLHPSEVAIEPRFQLQKTGLARFVVLEEDKSPRTKVEGVGNVPLQAMVALAKRIVTLVEGSHLEEEARRGVTVTHLVTLEHGGENPYEGRHFLVGVAPPHAPLLAHNLRFTPPDAVVSPIEEVETGPMVDVRPFL